MLEFKKSGMCIFDIIELKDHIKMNIKEKNHLLIMGELSMISVIEDIYVKAKKGSSFEAFHASTKNGIFCFFSAERIPELKEFLIKCGEGGNVLDDIYVMNCIFVEDKAGIIFTYKKKEHTKEEAEDDIVRYINRILGE